MSGSEKNSWLIAVGAGLVGVGVTAIWFNHLYKMCMKIEKELKLQKLQREATILQKQIEFRSNGQSYNYSRNPVTDLSKLEKWINSIFLIEYDSEFLKSRATCFLFSNPSNNQLFLITAHQLTKSCSITLEQENEIVKRCTLYSKHLGRFNLSKLKLESFWYQRGLETVPASTNTLRFEMARELNARTGECLLDACIWEFKLPTKKLFRNLPTLEDFNLNPKAEGCANLLQFPAYFQTNENERRFVETDCNAPVVKDLYFSSTGKIPYVSGDEKFGYFYYTAGTAPGSAGCPIFDQHWKMIGMHHFSAFVGPTCEDKNMGTKIRKIFASSNIQCLQDAVVAADRAEACKNTDGQVTDRNVGVHSPVKI